jgi:CcmD family protein
MNLYLFLAYAFVWLIFFIYVWNLSRRRQRLEKELDELQARIGRGTNPSSYAFSETARGKSGPAGGS